MTGQIGTQLGTIFAEHYAHSVSYAQRWGDPWLPLSNLYANWVFYGSGPKLSEAELEWYFGEGIMPGTDAFQEYPSTSLIDYYVKVEIEQGEGNESLTWYGIVKEDTTDRDGALITSDDERLLTGSQRLRAVGMEHLLQRTFVTTSWFYRSRATTPTEIKLPRALTFNAPNGMKDAGNRHSQVGSRAAYLFTDALDSTSSAKYWSTREILRYLFVYHKPLAADGINYVTFKLTTNTLANVLPYWDRPVVRADGRSVWELLNELCDRRRNLSWKAIVNDTSREIEIEVFTFNSTVLALPSGNAHLPNPNTKQLDFDRAVDVKATLTDSATQLVDQVVVTGARKRSCFTISGKDETLEPDWKTSDQTEYDAGPANISGLSSDEQERRIEDFRAADKFDRVYSWFRLPIKWNGLAGDGIGGSGKFPISPDNEAVYLPDLRFERFLPRELIDAAPPGSANTPLAPIALVKVEDADTTATPPTPDRWQHVEKMAVATREMGAEDAATDPWGASLRMQTEAPGVILKVTGAPQYMIAKDVFSSLDGDREPEIDYRESLIVTAMIQLDSLVEVRHPATPAIGFSDVARRVYIDVGDEARLDYLVQGTVTGIDDGELQHTAKADAGYIRDDREAMRDVARLAYEWYGYERQAFQFEIQQLTNVLSVGDLITQVGAAETLETVNSVVTGHRIDLRNCRTTYTTGFAELDFSRMYAG